MTLIDLGRPVAQKRRIDTLPVAVIGAGPIGLAAAANLAERGIEFTVFEAGDSVADSVRKWGHIRLFSPWRHLVDPASARLLQATGWSHPAEEALPNGAELVEEYLMPLAALPVMHDNVRTGVEVLAVSREGMDRTRTRGRAATPFMLRIRDAQGEITDLPARAVIDASGTYRTPNSLGSSGLDPLGLAEVADLVSHALPDVLGTECQRFAGRHTVVVGAGHSAANTLINLAALAEKVPGTRVTWTIRNRGAARVSTSPDDELVARAKIGGRVDTLVERGVIDVVDRFEIVRLMREGESVRIVGNRGGELADIEADVVVNATGFRPNLDMLREIRLELDDIVEAPKRLAPLIDPNEHSCGTVEPHGFAELRQPEDGFFIAGMKSYGRAPTFLLATGYEQVRSIAAWIDGDTASATKVELSLPATGVCSTDGGSAGGGCCS
ncbi:FAD-dependent oxidoreductase [Microbacterium sp. R86528]|uniref:FAD-dependent oxidoreductase n=1 Tax=Microbacterium sp. R86528 TaxID=3093864 RepID=UPI0037C7ECFC